MRTGWTVSLCVLLFWLTSPLSAQQRGPAEAVSISGSQAYTWMIDRTSVIQLEGPVRIDLTGVDVHMTAQQAVVWVTTVPGSFADLRHLEVSLVGDAVLNLPNQVTRSGGRLYTDAFVRGPIRISAAKRSTIDQSGSDLYKAASAMRPILLQGGQPSGRWLIQEEQAPTGPTTQPTGQVRPLEPLRIQATNFRTIETPQGKVAAILSGNVNLVQRTAEGDLLELRANNAVVFTPYTNLREIPTDGGGGRQPIERAATGAYLEGDVRITRTPADIRIPDQRLQANRAYYDFTTDRAVLTDVIMHTADPNLMIPIVVRAETVRQLSQREYTAENARVSTSTFHTPSYSIGASKIYLRNVDTGDPVLGSRTYFSTRDATLDLWGFPVFYAPGIAGSVTERNLLRHIEVGNSKAFGYRVQTEWGLFESLGRLPPKGMDASYNLDYFTDRGPATGVNAKYTGGFVDAATLEPWSYSGDFRSYFIYDHGEDDLGRRRENVIPPDEMRGYFYWRHQQFLPGDWQIQVTGGYISDPTFLEEWYNRQFRTNPPMDTAIYAKHQRDTEAITFLISGQPNDFATTAEVYQEQAEIERLPEIGYHRIGDSIFDDSATFFSTNSLAGLQFRNSDYDLADLGFAPAAGGVGRYSPGIPSFGQTGTPESVTYRGDFRQELDWPLSVSRFRVVPYVIGRYTEYSESVDGGSAERLYAGGGMRITTAFWKVDDSVKSELFDLHRLRHVVEPELNVYASAQSADRDNFLIYDEPIDAINDISAVQFALNQRWQTKRGGPGAWHSTDFFSFNVAVNHFFNQPPERELDPSNFRGLYFVSMPEASVPRNSVNADATWRVSDTVSILSDAQFNTDYSELATASIGFSAKHDPRLSYYLGLRHIGLDFTEVVQNGRNEGNTYVFENQELVIAAIDYQLTSKYRVQIANAYDIAQHRNDRSTVTLIRHFDRFYAAISFRVDEFENENSVFFNVWPDGLRPAGGSQSARRFLGD